MDEKKPGLSAVMILRDEASTLEKAIESIHPVCDELIVGIDAKTTDGTEALANRIAQSWREEGKDAVVYLFDFHDDFSSARNIALDRATREWVLIIDGHEWLEQNGIPTIRGAMAQIAPPVSGIHAHLLIFDPDSNDEMPAAFIPQPRIFRNNLVHRYCSAVHNQLMTGDNEYWLYNGRVCFGHKMPPERGEWRKKQRFEMNIRRLKEELARSPDDSRCLQYMGNTFLDAGKERQSLPWYKRFVKVCDPKKFPMADRYAALARIGQIIYAARKSDADIVKAKEWLYRAVEESPTRAEAYWMLGVVAEHAEDWDRAIHWHDLAAQQKVPTIPSGFHNVAVYAHAPWVGMCRAWCKKGEWRKARDCCLRVVQCRPFDNEFKHRLLEIEREIKLRDKGAVRIVVFDRLGSFTSSLLEDWKARGHFVTTAKQFDPELVDRHDLVFCEWADENVVTLTKSYWNRHVVVRLHSYELYAGYHQQINWNNVDVLIFVSPAMRLKFETEVPEDRRPNLKILTIPNGLDLEKFNFRDHAPGSKIAWAGRVDENKNLPLALEGFRFICDRARIVQPHLYIAGEFQSSQAYDYVHNWIHISGMGNRVHLEGWQEDMNAWLEDKDFLLTSSTREGWSYVVAEAMAKGIKPLVHAWPGAGLSWPQRLIWKSVSELWDCFSSRPYESTFYRQWVAEKYDLKEQLKAMHAVIEERCDLGRRAR